MSSIGPDYPKNVSTDGSQSEKERDKKGVTDRAELEAIEQACKRNEQRLLGNFPTDANSTAAAKAPEIGDFVVLRSLNPSFGLEVVSVVELVRESNRID